MCHGLSAFYLVNLCEMSTKVAKLANMAQIWTWRPIIRPIIHQQVMLEGSEFLKSPHKLVLPENVSISDFYTVFLGEMGPKEGKLVNLYQIWTCRPIIRPIIHQRVMLEGSEYPKSPHKLVLPENVSISAFYTVILGEFGSKSGKTGQFGPNLDL